MCNGQLKGRDGLAIDSGDVPASDLRPHTDTLFYTGPVPHFGNLLVRGGVNLDKSSVNWCHIVSSVDFSLST